MFKHCDHYQVAEEVDEVLKEAEELDDDNDGDDVGGGDVMGSDTEEEVMEKYRHKKGRMPNFIKKRLKPFSLLCDICGKGFFS